jgi:hypothetical protein
VHASDEAKSIARESWHRFSSRVARPTAVARPASSSHGWADFAPVATIADARQARAGTPACGYALVRPAARRSTAYGVLVSRGML